MTEFVPPATWHDLAAAVLAAAKSHKVEAEVRFRTSDQLVVKVRKGKLEEIRQSTPSGASLRVFDGKRCVSGSTSHMDKDRLVSLLDELCSCAKVVDEDDANGLPEAEQLYSGEAELDLYDPNVEGVGVDKARDLALACEEGAFSADARVTQSEGASLSTSTGTTFLCNSRGLEATARGSFVSVQAQPVAEDDKGNKYSDGWWSSARYLSDLEDPALVGKEAGLRAAAQIGADKVATGRFPVLFAPEAASGLQELLFQCISGTAVYRNSTFLAGKENTPIAAPILTLIDDPLKARGLASAAFDAEGVATSRRTLVDQGVLKLYPCDCFAARRLGRKSTGHSGGGGVTSYNLYVLNGDKSPAELLSALDTGLLVTSFIGFGFNQATGDFSRGIRGFWVEKGKRIRPVQEVTVSSNLGAMLTNIVGVGNDLHFRSGTDSPSLLVREMSISGS